MKHLESTKGKGNDAFKKERYNEAFELYTEALAIDPLNKRTNAKLHSNRSIVCEKVIRDDPFFICFSQLFIGNFSQGSVDLFIEIMMIGLSN